MTEKTKRLLMIFAKPPVPGRVKTRLAKDLGEQAATDIYRKLLNHTAKVVNRVDCRKQLWLTNPAESGSELPEFAESDTLIQKGRNLGERISYAFRQAFESGNDRVVIIGSDCPDITVKLIEDAFQALDESDLVIGPGEDGGYWLLGMKEYRPELFREVAWSTPAVLAQTEKIADRLGLHVDKLKMLNDIDTISDLEKSGLKL